jgi:hypothetical protein
MTGYEISFSITAVCPCCGKDLPSNSYLTVSKPSDGPFNRDNPYERKDRRVFITPCPDCFEWKGPLPVSGEAEYASWRPCGVLGTFNEQPKGGA